MASRLLSEERVQEQTRASYGQLRQQYGLRLGQDRAGETLARFHALYTLARPIAQEALASEGSPVERLRAADAYALGLAALATLGEAQLACLPSNGYNARVGVGGATPSDRERLLFSPVFQQYAAYARNGKREQATAAAQQLVGAFYRAATDSLEQLPTPLRAAIDRSSLTVGERTYAGLAEQGLAQASPLVRVRMSLDQVVGNEEPIRFYRRVGFNLARHDVERNVNPYHEAGGRIPLTSLMTGESGTAKSLILHLWGQELEEFGAAIGKPVSLLSLDNSGKTKMQNSAGEALNALLNTLLQKPGIYAVKFDEADGVIPRKSGEAESGDEHKFEQMLLVGLSQLKMLDRGNVHIGGATNRDLSYFDKRIQGRIAERHFVARGADTPEKQAQLYRLQLSHLEELSLLAFSEAEWQQLGARSSEGYAFNGRDIKLISERLSSLATSSAEYDGSTPMAEQVDLLRQSAEDIRADWRAYGTPITMEHVLALFEEQDRLRVQDADRVRSRRVEELADVIMLNEEARQEAGRRLAGE